MHNHLTQKISTFPENQSIYKLFQKINPFFKKLFTEAVFSETN